MRNAAPPLLPLLRSRTQGDLLALLFLHPDQEYTLTRAAALVGVPPSTMHHEVNRLVENGLAVDRRVGQARLLRAATDTLLAGPLTDLLAVTYGPLPVLAETLAPVPDVERAFIYGSWAARHAGEPGPVPNDVDALVVGTADLDSLDDIADAAEQRLRRPVTIRRVRPQAWADLDGNDPFLRSVRERPLVELPLAAHRESQ